MSLGLLSWLVAVGVDERRASAGKCGRQSSIARQEYHAVVRHLCLQGLSGGDRADVILTGNADGGERYLRGGGGREQKMSNEN